MADYPIPSPDELRQLFRYDPETGILYHRPRPIEMFGAGNRKHHQFIGWKSWNTKFADKRAGTYDTQGRRYRVGLRIEGTVRPFMAHRVIWAIVHGEWPKGVIDHINGDATDNRLDNLRDVSPLVNNRNQAKHVTNKSGHSGVFWNRHRNKWTGSVRSGADGAGRTVGHFDAKEDAIKAVAAWRRELGYSERHGK